MPDSLWLTQSDRFALAAVGRTTAGDSVSPAVVWSGTGGAIDTAGQYIAGLVIWCELAPPTWSGSPVLFTRQAALESPPPPRSGSSDGDSRSSVYFGFSSISRTWVAPGPMYSLAWVSPSCQVAPAGLFGCSVVVPSCEVNFVLPDPEML